ncbi:EAL domain-containing protein [Achromobacter sp. DH1f]|uniref:EAL domain-containing protein n=1 Tax=Achromobacter sp. DH1f TaxID=1397275 RepID=UPI00068ABF46|nr:EAL domain-containing protein [Achromobacter sp. DH1f]
MPMLICPDCRTPAAPALVANAAPLSGDGQRIAPQDDLACAARLSADLHRQGVVLAFQAIVATVEPAGPLLYHEGLARAIMPDAHGEMATLAPTILSLEQLGQIRGFDRCVVNATINTLRVHPHLQLGCNVSAQSAVIDDDWTHLVRQLRQEPGIACRLTLEFTETSRIDDPQAALEFIQLMQTLGCRIAFDDFGTGAIAPDFVIRAHPDIIKIDKGYLFRARESRQGRTILRHLVQLCAAITRTVVLEGVETREDQVLAEQAGAPWMQGYGVGRPTVLPPGLHTPCVVLAPSSSLPGRECLP